MIYFGYGGKEIARRLDEIAAEIKSFADTETSVIDFLRLRELLQEVNDLIKSQE